MLNSADKYNSDFSVACYSLEQLRTDIGSYVGAISLDMSKGFDTVPHKFLCYNYKLFHDGIAQYIKVSYQIAIQVSGSSGSVMLTWFQP